MKLFDAGLQWVLCSNVSGVGTSDDDLIIRFHNASLYKYFGQAKLFDAMLNSNSKGHFVWAKLRKPKVAYQKIGSLPLDQDTQVSDDELFKVIDTRGIAVEERLLALGMFIPNATGTLDLIGLKGLLG